MTGRDKDDHFAGDSVAEDPIIEDPIIKDPVTDDPFAYDLHYGEEEQLRPRVRLPHRLIALLIVAMMLVPAAAYAVDSVVQAQTPIILDLAEAAAAGEWQRFSAHFSDGIALPVGGGTGLESSGDLLAAFAHHPPVENGILLSKFDLVSPGSSGKIARGLTVTLQFRPWEGGWKITDVRQGSDRGPRIIWFYRNVRLGTRLGWDVFSALTGGTEEILGEYLRVYWPDYAGGGASGLGRLEDAFLQGKVGYWDPWCTDAQLERELEEAIAVVNGRALDLLKVGFDAPIFVSGLFNGTNGCVVRVGSQEIIALDPGRIEGRTQLEIVLAHEFWHVIHMRVGTLTTRTVGGKLLAEGAATLFSEAALPGHSPADYLLFSEGELNQANQSRAELYHQLVEDFNSEDRDVIHRYFKGGQGEGLDRIGYYLGYRLLKAYLADHPGSDIRSLLILRPEEVLDYLQFKLESESL